MQINLLWQILGLSKRKACVKTDLKHILKQNTNVKMFSKYFHLPTGKFNEPRSIAFKFVVLKKEPKSRLYFCEVQFVKLQLSCS